MVEHCQCQKDVKKKEFLETVQTNFDRNFKVSFHLTAESDNMIAAAEH